MESKFSKEITPYVERVSAQTNFIRTIERDLVSLFKKQERIKAKFPQFEKEQKDKMSKLEVFIKGEDYYTNLLEPTIDKDKILKQLEKDKEATQEEADKRTEEKKNQVKIQDKQEQN